MTEAPEGLPLPPSIGGLFDFAYASYVQRAPLYLGLGLLVFVVGCFVEVALPPAKLGTPAADVKIAVFSFAALFADSYVIAAVALGIGARLAGEACSTRRLLGAAAERWLAVIVCTLTVQLVAGVTARMGGLGPLPDPPAAILLTAPFVWLLWGMLSLAAPIAALSPERPAFAVFAGFARAVSLSLRPANLPRLAIVAFVSIVPNLLQEIAYDAMLQHHVARPIFWAQIPIDALTVGPVAALQTVFAIDFARRVADQRSA